MMRNVLKYLLVIPAFVLGVLVGTVILGIMPTLAMDVFIPEFHYSDAARMWVRGAGFVGGAYAAVMTAVFLWRPFNIMERMP